MGSLNSEIRLLYSRVANHPVYWGVRDFTSSSNENNTSLMLLPREVPVPFRASMFTTAQLSTESKLKGC